MMPVEWPIAAGAADHPVDPARPAGRDRLSAVRADFFLDDRDRLTEQERALMGAMLAALLDQLVDEIAVGLPPVLAEQVELARPGLLRRLWDSGALDRPGLVSLFLDSSFTVSAVSQPQNPKIEKESPATNADKVRPAGLNHDQLNASPTSELPDLAIARKENPSSMTS